MWVVREVSRDMKSIAAGPLRFPRLRVVVPAQAQGELRVNAVASAPHAADPRLPTMRCGWQASMSAWCGKVGKVIEVGEQLVP